MLSETRFTEDVKLETDEVASTRHEQARPVASMRHTSLEMIRCAKAQLAPASSPEFSGVEIYLRTVDTTRTLLTASLMAPVCFTPGSREGTHHQSMRRLPTPARTGASRTGGLQVALPRRAHDPYSAASRLGMSDHCRSLAHDWSPSILEEQAPLR